MIGKLAKTLMAGAALAATLSFGASAQTWDPDYEPPRMPDGTPSFQGIWTNASLTSLERSAMSKSLTVPDHVATAIENGMEARMAADLEPTDPDAPPPTGGQGAGGYNTFWMDPGTRIMRVNGEARSSIIVEPEDGRLPWSEEGKKTMQETRHVLDNVVTDPEIRASGERCTVGFGSTGGAPMLSVLYNNNYQFVQEPETVAIVVEMNHNTRLIRMNDEHRPANMLGWLGDSVGEWDGDTLVVHTTNFHPGNAYRGATRHRIYITEDADVVERFTRVSDDEIFYEFTVTDPDVYTQPWKGEAVFRSSEGPIYEYACHEANYSLPGILGGARLEEKEAAEAAQKSGASK